MGAADEASRLFGARATVDDSADLPLNEDEERYARKRRVQANFMSGEQQEKQTREAMAKPLE